MDIEVLASSNHPFLRMIGSFAPVAAVPLQAGRPKWIARSFRLLDLTLHPIRHRRVAQSFGASVYQEVRKRQPQLGLKYLHPRHLAKGLTTNERAAAIIHHYNFMQNFLPTSLLVEVNRTGACLWSEENSGGLHKVVLAFSHPTDNEGELTLDYTVAGVSLAVCSFTFVAGELVARTDTTIIAITRIQGVRAEYEASRAAMKSLASLSAPMILMASIGGLAAALRQSRVAGVVAKAQVSRVDDSLPPFTGIYDDLFTALGGTLATSIFYDVPIPYQEKPLLKIKSSNRARTREQRAIKARITASTRSVMRT